MSDDKNKQGKKDDNKKEDIFRATNPTTGEVISEHPYISDADLEKVVEKAWNSFQKQRDINFKERAAKLKKVAETLEKEKEKYGKLITAQMGKPITQSILEVTMSADVCRYFANNAEEMLKPKERNTKAKRSYVHLEPIGIIYQIVPFNYPLLISFWTAAPSLLLGNTIIHRNAQTCPGVGLAIEKLLQEAGFDDGEFTNVFTRTEQTNILLAHKKIRGVTFTGSTKAGSTIAEVAGKHIKPAVIELGGSDPVIILDDAELEKAVKTTVDSRLENAGQVCTAGKRIIVDEKIYEKFLEKLTEKVKTYKVGDPTKEETEMGPMARVQLLETIEDQVKRGLEAGGKLILGGKRYDSGEFAKGNYFQPTIIEVKEDNILVTEETFGPVFAILRAKDENDCLRIANDTEYGLSAVIVSSNAERADKIARRIEAGSVFVNTPSEQDVQMPFGGVKSSGIGRECGEWGLEEFANIKTIWHA